MQQTIQKQTHKTKKKNAWKYILSVLIILIYILPIYVLVVIRGWLFPTNTTTSVARQITG